MTSENRLLSRETLARYRIRLGWLGGLLFLYLAAPRHRWIFLAGFLLSLAGEGVRLWAAGTIKKDRVLARSGPYALVRHPLYLGSFLILAGFCLSSLSFHHWVRTGLLWVLALGGFAWLYRRKMADEEASLQAAFGNDYTEFKRSTPAFWPDLLKLDAGRIKEGTFNLALAIKNKEHHTVAGVLAAAAALWFKLVYTL